MLNSSRPHYREKKTPVDKKSKPSAHSGSPVSAPTDDRGIAGQCKYLTLTRFDIAFAVQQDCLFMHEFFAMSRALFIMVCTLHTYKDQVQT